MIQTIGSLSEKFKRTYRLTDSSSLAITHDVSHITTGFGIGIADELRLRALEACLHNTENLLDLIETYRDQSWMERTLKGWIRNTETLNAKENGLEQKQYQALQLRTVPLDMEEVRKFYQLGHEINEKIRDMTGKYLVWLSAKEIAALDVSKLDYTAEAHKIRTEFEKPENREIAVAAADILNKAAVRLKTGEAIPLAGRPWHGPLKKTF